MNAPNPYRHLLVRTAAALAICIPLVIVCYFFVDKPVAFFVHDHGIPQTPTIKWLTEPPPLVQGWAPLLVAILLATWAWQPPRLWQRTLVIACLSLIVADQCRESIGDVCGRYWPETWHNNNPSLIGTGAYGFHPFETGDDIGSFPSGHASRIAGFAGVFWIAYPRRRWLCLLIAVPMALSLIAMNYHFVGDVIAGSFLGGITAAYAATLARLDTKS